MIWSLIRSLLSPIISIALLMFGNGFFLSFLSVHLKSQGFRAHWIGYVQACYFAGLALGALRIERIIRRIGHIRAYATFGSLLATTMVLLGLSAQPLLWLSSRFIAGLATAGLWIVIESWLMEVSTPSTRGQVLSLYMISFYFSLAVGQFLFSFVDLAGAEPFLVAILFTIFSIVPVSLTKYPSPPLHEPNLPNLFSVFRISPFGVSGCFLAGAILSVIYSFQPVFAYEKGISIPLLMSTTIFGGMILQWPIGKLSDLLDRRKVLLLTALCVIPPALMMLFSPKIASLVFVAAFFLGGITFTLYPLSITQVCDQFEVHNITAVTGVLLLAYGVGSTVGPLAAPYFMISSGVAYIYTFIILMALLLSFVGFYSLFFRKTVPLEEQQNYVPLPSISTAAFELDPRATDETAFDPPS